MAPLLRCCVLILLLFFLTLEPVAAEGNGPWLHRQRREWIIAPRKLKENHDYTGLESIARIRSDKEYNETITYSISGPGVDQPPYRVFSVNHENGLVKIHSILDREERSEYNLKGSARFKDGRYAEKDIDLKITVEDVNDCPPIIKPMQVGSVNESSAAGTLVMRVIATDADQENTLHTKIFYSIAQESNGDGMFYINSETGDIMVRQTTLDREIKDTYKLMIRANDMNGQGGLSTGGEVVIKIKDINDNVPTLEKEVYEGSVQENTVNTEVMRIQSIDRDLIHTDNWNAVYEIVSGNEAGYFSITTDAKTNEGIIVVNKPLDYEELKVVNLGVGVSNKAQYNFGSTQMSGIVQKSYPVKINVVNQKEGPRFLPGVKVVTISEDRSSSSLKEIITNYAATDSDTLLTATNVRYAKIRDDDNWLIIDEKTADIRLNKLPDRESKFLVNGTYYAEIICMTDDNPSKTATGTIAIQVEDFNDHCPKLTTTVHTMCLEDNVLYATAMDEDEFPNSAPFEFRVIEDKSKGKWTVEHFNDTTAILRDNADLWPGIYQVAVEVKDQQGKACGDLQVVDVTVCTCEKDTKVCTTRSSKSTSLGAGGILLLLLGLLLLLLLPLLLLFCLCGGAAAAGDFKSIPFDTKQQLISYHTEGQGEDKEVPLLHVPVEVDGSAMNNKESGLYKGDVITVGAAMGKEAGFGTQTFMTEEEWLRYREERGYEATGMESGFSRRTDEFYNGMALSDQFLKEYFANKANHATQQSQQKDGLLVYDYEGQESLAGSVGCCSLLENDTDLAFLNDLGPKFKTLAEICQGSTIVTQISNVDVSTSLPRPVSPVRPSTSSHTQVHTHTESIRDRDRVHVNAVDISNVATGSSTILQEEVITERAQVPNVQVQDKIMIPSQTLLIQQPTMYYTAAPMYVVESQPQMMLVTGGAQQQVVGQIAEVGLSQGMSQGLVQVGGHQGSQGVVLVDSQVGVDGAMGQMAQGLSQGTISRSRKVLLVENGSTAGQQGGQFVQGFIQTGRHVQGQDYTEQGLGVSGQGLEVRGQGLEVRGQGFEMRAPSFAMGSVGSVGSTGSKEDFYGHTQVSMGAPKSQGSQKLVVQHKRVSVTERNTESNTRA